VTAATPPVPATPLPEDAVLLHLGFHKTGTTALQSVFAASRPSLLEQGVLYPGRRRSHHPAAMAMTNRTWGVGREGGADPDQRAWTRLARAATRHPGRVLISSESFALTPDANAARMVADLGPERVHVVFTLRPVASLLSSSWQQYLKSGWTIRYGDWLEQMMSELAPGARRSGFWLRNDYPAIVGRWASLVGPDRVHLVCLDSGDRGFLLRTFGQLLGLPEGHLDPARADSNRSMTAAEAELLRALNEHTSDWDWPTYQRTVRAGAATGMVEGRRPVPDEAPLPTPEHVIERAAAYGRDSAAALAALGVVVHGDLSVLGQPLATAVGDPGDGPVDVPVEAAVAAILGAIRGAQRQAEESAQAAASASAGSAAEVRAPAGSDADPAPGVAAEHGSRAGRPRTGLLGRLRRPAQREPGGA
jgi:hypothetical protein